MSTNFPTDACPGGNTTGAAPARGELTVTRIGGGSRAEFAGGALQFDARGEPVEEVV